MKRVLSIIFGLMLVGCLTGCQSTKVEEPVKPVEPEFRTSLSIEVTEGTSLGNSKWDKKVIGTYEVPRDGKIEFENPTGLLQFLVKCDVHWDNKISIGVTSKKVELEYFVYEDCEVLKITQIYEPNTYKKTGKKRRNDRPYIYEDDRLITFYFLSGTDGAHHVELATKFYETEPIFANLKELD